MLYVFADAVDYTITGNAGYQQMAYIDVDSVKLKVKVLILMLT